MTERSAVDDHFQLVVDQKAEEKLRRALGLLNGSGIGYIVEGGWAMAAVGSPTPSVDLDVMFRGPDYQRLYDHILKTTDLQLDTHGGLEALGIDWRHSDEPNRLFTKRDLFYVPDDFLRNRITTGTINTVGGPLHVRVPAPAALAFMKMKAFHDRRMQWEASRDPTRLARLAREDAATVRERPAAYWERKAGKDLYDIAFLARNSASAIKQLLTDEPIDQAILAALRDPPAPLVSFAIEMAKRSRERIPDPNTLHGSLKPDAKS